MIEPGQKVRLRATGAEVVVHDVRASGVVVVVEATGHHFGVVGSELAGEANESAAEEGESNA